MLEAVLYDAARAALEDEVYTLIKERHDVSMPAGISEVFAGEDWRDTWRDLLAEMDAVLVIAPEEEDTLLELCLEVRAAGCKSLNCTPDAIRLAGDKLALTNSLECFGIPAVPARLYRPGDSLPYADAVIKPRDGAGCEETYHCSEKMLPESLDADRQWVVQPWQQGLAVSLSLLVSGTDPELLSCNRMDCTESRGRLQVQAVRTGACDSEEGLRAEAEDLAQRIVYGIPGLQGYIGIDAFWEDGVLAVLEVNPRLTLSYVGLSGHLGMPDLAARMLRTFR